MLKYFKAALLLKFLFWAAWKKSALEIKTQRCVDGCERRISEACPHTASESTGCDRSAVLSVNGKSLFHV